MEYVHAISLPAKAGMLEIIRKIYENIDSTETINPIDINKKPCAGVGSRAYLYSLMHGWLVFMMQKLQFLIKMMKQRKL